LAQARRMLRASAIAHPLPATLLGTAAGVVVLWALRRPKSAPPAYNPGLPFFGPLIAFLKDPLACIARGAKELETGVYSLQLFHRRMNILVGPEAHKAFFEANDETLDQAPVYKFMVPVFGKGVLYDAGLHKRKQQIRFLARALTSNDLMAYPAVIGKEAAVFFKSLPNEVDLLPQMASLTILTASATLLGREVRENLFGDVSRLFNKLDEGISPLSVLAPYAPTPAHRARDKAHKEIIALFSSIVRKRRENAGADGPKAKDVLQKLLDSKYKDGNEIPEHEIAGMLIGMLFAGQHTSSITSTWTLLLLLDDAAKGGEWLAKAREEVLSLEPEPGAFKRGELTSEALAQMTILQACLREAIRLFPPLILLMRRVSRPLHVGKYIIPAGEDVVVSPAVASRLAEVFDDPDEFRPGRWLESKPKHEQFTFGFIGFGGGIHACMGEAFAMMQLRTVLAVFLANFPDARMTGSLPSPDYTAMVVPPHGPNLVQLRKPGEERKFTLGDVAEHATNSDAWIASKGGVYDVTAYADEHPGGPETLLAWAGRDASEAIDGPQHPRTIHGVMKTLRVGALESE